MNMLVHIIFVLGSCLGLNLNYTGCCDWLLSSSCSNDGCYCDQACYEFGDCCNDVADIGCHPTSPSSPNTLGKTN